MNNIIIFSVDKGGNANQDEAARIVAESFLDSRGLSYHFAEGVYNGQVEQSYVIEHSDAAQRAVYMLALAFDQESVLVVDDKGYASLHFIGQSDMKPLGVFTKLDEKPIISESYTYVKGDYYAVRSNNDSGVIDYSKFYGLSRD